MRDSKTIHRIETNDKMEKVRAFLFVSLNVKWIKLPNDKA
jgi:hypothetical protein